MEIQQHNGVVVVEERGNPAGLRQAPAREEEESREAPGLQVRLPSLPSLYRVPRGTDPRRSNLQGGRRSRGGFPPQAKWGAPHP